MRRNMAYCAKYYYIKKQRKKQKNGYKVVLRWIKSAGWRT